MYLQTLGLVIGETGWHGQLCKTMNSESDLPEIPSGKWLGRLAQEALAGVCEAVFFVGPDGRILYANSVAGRHLGYSPEELLLMRVDDLFQSDSLGSREQRRRDLDHCGTLAIRSFFRVKDGRMVETEAKVGSYQIEGEPYGLIVANDLSGRQQTDEALPLSEERFSALIEHAFDTITVLDADGTITFKSPPPVPYAGYSAEELLGKYALRNVHPADLPQVLEAWETVKSQPCMIRTVEFRVRYKDGSWGVLQSTMKNLLEDSRVRAWW